MMISVTLIGNAPQPVLRSGASPGDVLLVTGALGDSAAGLELLLRPELNVDAEKRDFLLARHHKPAPRLREMQAALQVGNVVRGALDLSDGLAGDAAHIARQSNVTLEIETERLPISPACRGLAKAAGHDALQWALSGGEDYELLLCVAPEKANEVTEAIQNATGTPVTIIGRCVPQEIAPVVLVQNGVRQDAPVAFTHF
jgi:thiamine-monophosphate kinase